MSPSDWSDSADEALVIQAANNPPGRDAVAELYRRHARTVLPMLHARLPPDAVSDLHQELWLRITRELPKMADRMTNFRAWVFRIAGNLIEDFYRAKKSLPMADGFDPPAKQDLDEEIFDNDHREALRKCLETLGPDYRNVVEAMLAGEDAADLAKRLGTKPELIYQRKSRGLKSLKDCVEQRLS